MYFILELLLNRLIFGYYAHKYIKIDDLISRPTILQWLSFCVFIPVQEEIMFRYAFYHLLENYINDIMTINIINGVVFGLLHASNGLIVKLKPLDYLMIILANSHLGYCLAILHNNLFLCMVVHGVYNFIGISIMLYWNENNNIVEVRIDDVIIYTQPRRRAMSLGFVNNFEFFHRINKSSINPEIAESTNKYREMEKNRIKKYENMI
ncbi:CAAX protease family protein [Klosneuvirus KNV1]|uniref:CAAX protease family protein n=1 Tax=Klosneuvirus KNV1 TaxID=1977640 RepID=A0A1V0SK33_9VIRU|nr:CAAX protease family protein [Klosneuvirus KNV1]